MRQYPLHYLNEDNFEKLTILICSKILGEGVIPFAKGPDGGRDGRFTGKANSFPSEVAPWEGKIVIQAKHTIKENSSCSDYTFQQRLKKEVVPAISRLKGINKVDYYLLFSNSKLPGRQDEKIEDYIDENTNITNVIIGIERIQLFLNTYPDIVRILRLNVLLRPLQFDENDLKEIVFKIHKNLPVKEILERNSERLNYIGLERKNELNDLGEKYFDNVIKNSFIYFKTIKSFLSDTINKEYLDLYEDTIAELNAKISLHREEYASFELIMEDLFDYIISNNPELKGKKRIVRVFLHYMYCNCDIGIKE